MSVGSTVREIAQLVGISVPATNRHLDVLRDSGLIAGHLQGQENLHVLTPLGAALLTRRAPE
jgi:DNA-binding transcriptional ArsR family regulator